MATPAASAEGGCNPAIPSSCQITAGPAPLLSQSIDGGDGIYAATDARYASLVNLENQAVQNTLADHGLPQSDATAAQTWGRSDATAELWQLMTNAMSTPASATGQAPGDTCRTIDQQNAVDWLSTVDQRDAQQAAEDAGLEYVKWAGLDESAYQQLFSGSTFPSQDTITAFLCGGSSSNCPVTPADYAGQVTTCPTTGNCTKASNGNYYTEGFCGYQPPSPFQSDYSDSTNAVCFGQCPEAADCVPFGPSYDQLAQWGAADVNNQLFDTPQYATAVNDVAVGVGFGVGTAAAITALSLAGIVLGTVSEAAVGAAASALFPFAAVAGVTLASIGALVLIAVAGAIAVAFFAVDEFNAQAVPGQLAQLMEKAQSTTPDLGSMVGDSSALGGLFSLFMGATMPTPDAGTCTTIDPTTGAPCLNAPSIPADSPLEQFNVSLNSGTASSPSLDTPVTSPTISWNDNVNGTTQAETAYPSGNWFVVTGSGGTPTQTLRIHYIDWDGNGQTAWLVNWPQVGYRFITVADQNASGTPVDPSTCLSDSTCSDSSNIHYIGTDGKEYSASVYSPLPQLGSVSFRSGTQPFVEGSPVTMSVTGSSPDGSPSPTAGRSRTSPWPTPLLRFASTSNSNRFPARYPLSRFPVTRSHTRSPPAGPLR